MIQVDKKIPLPPPGNSIYPWHTMKVGESFTVVLNKGPSIRATASRFGASKKGPKFRTRKEGDMIRCWRVA